MSLLKTLCDRYCLVKIPKIPRLSTAYSNTPQCNEEAGEFRVLQLIPKKAEQIKRRIPKVNILPPRESLMPASQDWPSVWPGPRTYQPSVVPLPLRQGYNMEGKPHPDKIGNAELMKIPNFLHLTPPAIKRQCEALKKFCTLWPVELETEEKCERYFPLESITSDYCYSSPTIREPLARIVGIRVKLSSLELDDHARDKFLRLLGKRYDSETDYVTIVADRCPTRKQNLEYADYLLTAVYHESWKIEPWEAEKSEADMEYYDWDKSQSRSSLVKLHNWPDPPRDDDYDKIPNSSKYKDAVQDLINNGEDEFSINQYKVSVKSLLNLKM